LAFKRKIYCLDTSGLSNPLENMPEDIYSILWSRVCTEIENGKFAANREIYDELTHLNGSVGDCIKRCKNKIVLEIGESEWDWQAYLAHVERMRILYKPYISEYNGNRKSTVGLNDVSIVALAKCVGLPLVSMEAVSFQVSQTKMRIPQLCNLENVQHMTFNDLLRLEGIKV
jgi:Domain of unknown function (DUF4411)